MTVIFLCPFLSPVNVIIVRNSQKTWKLCWCFLGILLLSLIEFSVSALFLFVLLTSFSWSSTRKGSGLFGFCVVRRSPYWRMEDLAPCPGWCPSFWPGAWSWSFRFSEIQLLELLAELLRRLSKIMTIKALLKCKLCIIISKVIILFPK